MDAWLPTFLKYARMRSPKPRKLELWALWPGSPPKRKLIAQAPAPKTLSFAGEEAEKLEALMEAFGAKLVWRVPNPQEAQKE